MVSMDSVIETGVDKLVELVKSRGRISFADAALQLGVSTTVIEEWADFLEEEGIISVEYKLTTPYLVEKKFSKQEVHEKAKEFSGQKDIFVRKAEVALNFLDRQAAQLKGIKAEFDKLKSELGLEADKVKDELKDLERFEQLKNNIDKDVMEQKRLLEKKFDDMNTQIMKEQNRYEQLTSAIQREQKRLNFEEQQYRTLEEGEEALRRRLEEFKDTIKDLKRKIHDEGSIINDSRVHIDKLKALARKVEESVQKDKGYVDVLRKKSKEMQKRLLDAQDEVIAKIEKAMGHVPRSENMSERFREFFNSKLHAFDLIDKINVDRNELEKELMQLLKKAKAFQLTGGGKNNEAMHELENRFKTVEEKKEKFEKELNEFNSLMESAA